jgi:hypothetical protein
MGLEGGRIACEVCLNKGGASLVQADMPMDHTVSHYFPCNAFGPSSHRLI